MTLRLRVEFAVVLFKVFGRLAGLSTQTKGRVP